MVALLGWGCVDASGDEEPELEPIELITTDPVPVELRDEEPSGPSLWKNVEILGGGFVTGIVFSPAAPNLIYARTDVGGAYRWNVTDERWVPLNDEVNQRDVNLMGIESIAADPVDPSRVYLAAGTYLSAGDGMILSSADYGRTWARHPIPAPMGGNTDGRSMGERLAVDPLAPSTLYFGSRNDGLWASHDAAESWRRVTAFPTTGQRDQGLSFVLFDGLESQTIYVGVAETGGGPTLYRSKDAGDSWEAVPGAPTGLMPHHGALGGDGLMYLTYNNGPGPNDITRGAVHRLDTNSGVWQDVTPRGQPPSFGYGGVSVDAQRPGTVMVTTIDLWVPDEIYRSTDGGESWREIGRAARRDPAGAEWLYFGEESLRATGWMGDIAIDPFNRSRVLYITGQGIWWSDDVTNADAGYATRWRFRNEGLEETVPLDLVSPPSGAPLLTALGDLSGFRHDDLDQSPPSGMFTSPRFGNSESIDFAEAEPAFVARVGTSADGARGAYSTDGGASWTSFATEPLGGRGSGTIAVSADGATLLWAPHSDEGPGSRVAYSRDRGVTWAPSTGIDLTERVRVAADRVAPGVFYAVSSAGVYRSVDGGETFVLGERAGLGGARLRPVFGQEGEVWLVSRSGIERSSDSAETFTPLAGVTDALALGFGHAAPGESYPALYLSGAWQGELGIFRSDDRGQSWTRINDDRHQFGWVGQISGDPRLYGRVYLGTGGRGVLYGDPR